MEWWFACGRENVTQVAGSMASAGFVLDGAHSRVMKLTLLADSFRNRASSCFNMPR